MAGYVRWRRETLVEQVKEHCSIDAVTGCWLWTRATDGGGYGKFFFEGKLWSVPRALLFVLTGELHPTARHKCDVRPCCWPEHLLWGTHLDNMADARERGRTCKGDKAPFRMYPEIVKRGEDCSWSRLTETNVREIRARIANGELAVDLALEFGLHQEYVGKIKRRLAWKHLTD